MPGYCNAYSVSGLPCLNFVNQGDYCHIHNKHYDMCCICYEDNTKPMKLSCNHVFCETCIMKYFFTNYLKGDNILCPYCRNNENVKLEKHVSNVIKQCNDLKDKYEISIERIKSIYLYNYYIVLFSNDWIIDSPSLPGSYLKVMNNLCMSRHYFDEQEMKKLSRYFVSILQKKTKNLLKENTK